jgi:hypothetical protein
MIIANSTSAFDDLFVLTNAAQAMLYDFSSSVEALEDMLSTCGYDHVGEITTVDTVEMVITEDNKPNIVIQFTYDNDAGEAEKGKFVVEVKNGELSGDFS